MSKLHPGKLKCSDHKQFYSLWFHTLRDRNEAAPAGDPPGCETIGYKTSKVSFHPLAAELDEIVPNSVLASAQ